MTLRHGLALVLLVGVPLGTLVLAPDSALSQDLGTVDSPAPIDPELLVGAPEGEPLGGPALDARTAEVGSLLRCPVCQGLSVEDSPATMAVNMKAQTKDMLAQGYTEDQILSYFERSYGEFVRLEPPLRGVNWLVWLAPIGALFLGGVVVVWMLRARGTAEETAPPDAVAPLPTRGTLPDDSDLARYVLRVREQAYGWPGGTPPPEES